MCISIYVYMYIYVYIYMKIFITNYGARPPSDIRGGRRQSSPLSSGFLGNHAII